MDGIIEGYSLFSKISKCIWRIFTFQGANYVFFPQIIYFFNTPTYITSTPSVGCDNKIILRKDIFYGKICFSGVHVFKDDMSYECICPK